MLVPTSGFDGQSYVYLYSAFGEQPDSGSTTYSNTASGFEEWSYLAKAAPPPVFEWSFSKQVASVAAPGPDDTGDTSPITNTTNSSLTALDGDQNEIDHPNQTITYQVVLTNDGTNDPIPNVTVTDSLLQDALPETVGTTTITDINGTSESITFAGDTNGNGVLDPGESWTWTFTYQPTQADINHNGTDGAGHIVNSAEAITTDPTAAAALSDNPNFAAAASTPCAPVRG